MYFAMSIPQLLIVVVIAMLIFGARRFKGIDDPSARSQLQRELGRTPVYSAETTTGKEAEFIRDRLPKRLPIAMILVGAVILGAIIWRLAR